MGAMAFKKIGTPEQEAHLGFVESPSKLPGKQSAVVGTPQPDRQVDADAQERLRQACEAAFERSRGK
jgi:hypothetical protein